MDIFSLWKQKYMNLLLVFNFTCITDVFYPRSRCRGMPLSYLIMYQVSVNILEQNEQSAIFLKPWQINKFDWELYIGSPASVPAEFDTRGQFSQSLFKVSCSDIQDGLLRAFATLCEYTLDLFLNGGKSKLSVIKFYTQLRSHLSLCLHTCEGDFEPFALRVLQLVDSHLLTNISYTWWKTHLDKW